MSDFVQQSFIAVLVAEAIIVAFLFMIWFFIMEEWHGKGWWSEKKASDDDVQ